MFLQVGLYTLHQPSKFTKLVLKASVLSLLLIYDALDLTLKLADLPCFVIHL